MTFPGPFWNLENPGSSIEKKAKIHSQVPPRFHPGSTQVPPRFLPGSSQVRQVGIGLFWYEILTKWLENASYELILGPFGKESWSRVRYWRSRRSQMASFGGLAKISKMSRNLRDHRIWILGSLNPPFERGPDCQGDPTI